VTSKSTGKSPNRKTLTVREAAEWLGIGINAAYAGVKAGTIPSLQVGDRFLVPRVALEKKLEGVDGH
jgi:excisionase family DNA binding protein